MMDWHIYNPVLFGDWDRVLLTLPGANFYQSFAWGEVKRRTGWDVLRLVALRDGQIHAQMQVLVRRQPLGGALVWVPGGVAGMPRILASSMKKVLSSLLSTRWIYIRMNALGFTEHEVSPDDMRTVGWQRPRVRMGSGMSMTYVPNLPEPQRVALASGNWRHNLKRSGKYDQTFKPWVSPRIDELIQIYRSMEAYKGLAEQVSNDELAAMLECLGDQLVLYRCDDVTGAPIALRGCALFGDQAWDILAAAAPVARKQYSSHGTLWALLGACAERGVVKYDMGGADQVKNKGVFDFKRGLGAEPFMYCGEWECASPSFMASVANLAMRLKGQSL